MNALKKMRWCTRIFGLLFFILAVSGVSFAQQMDEEIDTLTAEKIIIHKGDVVELVVYDLTRMAIVEPGIVDIISAEVDKIILTGSTEGETTLFVWDSKGKRRLEIQVIARDMDYLIKRIKKLFEAAKITGVELTKNDLEGKIVVSGKLKKERKEAYNKLIAPFNKDLLDLVVEDADLIEMDVQVTELTTTLSKVLGFDWTTGSESSIVLQYQETLPATKGDISDWFRIGDFNRTTALLATINFLITEGKARVLSKPNVVVTNGEAASFLVGGEIPITTTTTSEGNVSENVSYKSYGIDLTATPEIKDDKIDVILNVAIRDIDASNAVGDNTAFTTRTVDTRLLLNDGQTIVLAGLIKDNKGETLQRTPFLSKIPVMGLLFRKKTWAPNSEIEVVISFTAKILKDQGAGNNADKKKSSIARIAENIQEKLSKDEWGEEGFDVDFKAMGSSESGENPSASTVSNETEEGEGVAEEEEAAPAEEGESEDIASPQQEPVTNTTEISPEVDDVSDVLTAYVQGVQKKIAQAISYPYEAKEKGWEGTVTLSLTILSDGSLAKVFVRESSGRDLFDQDALNTAKVVAPFSPFPAEIDLEEIEITVPVVYSQAVVLDGSAR